MESIHAREGLRPLTHHRRQSRPSVRVSDEVGTDNERSSARSVKGRRRRKKKTLRKRAPRYRKFNDVPKDDSDSSDDDDDGCEGGSRLSRESRRKTATGRVNLPPEESKTVTPSGAMWSEGGGSDYGGGDEKSTLAARPNHGFIMPIIKITYADNDLEDIYGFDTYEDLIQEQWTNNQAYGYVRPNDEVGDVAKEKNEKRPVDSGRTKKNQANVQRKKYDPRKYINNKVRGRKRKTRERDSPLPKVQDQTVTKQTTQETKVQDQTVTKHSTQETKVQDQTVTKQKTQETLPELEKEALPAIFDESAEEDNEKDASQDVGRENDKENGEYVVSGPQGNDLYDKDRQMSLPPLSSHPPIPNGDILHNQQGATPRRRRPRAQSILYPYIHGHGHTHIAGSSLTPSRRSSAAGITKSKDDSRIQYELPIEDNDERARLPADPWRARKVRFYRNGDRYYHGYEFVFKPGRDVVNMEALCDKISDRIGLIKGARYIFGLDGRRKYRIEELEDGQSYVASSDRKFVTLPYGKLGKPDWVHHPPRRGDSNQQGINALPMTPLDRQPTWNMVPLHRKPIPNLGYGRQRPDWNQNALAGTPNALADRQGPGGGGRRGDNSRTGSPVVREVSKKSSADSSKSGNSKPGSRDGRTIKILNNTDHSQERTVLVNMKTVNLWEDVVKDVGKMFKLTGPLRLLSVLGEEVKSFSQFKNDFSDYDVFYVEQMEEASTNNNNLLKSPRSNKSTPPSASGSGNGGSTENGNGGRRKSLNGNDDRRSSISDRRNRSSSRRPTLRRHTSEPTLKETPEESDEYEEVTDGRSAVVTIRGQRRTLHAPRMPVKHNPALPHHTLTLDWVYGYRGSDSRKNLWVLPSGELLYYVAAVAVIMDAKDDVQRHYTEHTEDIQCMALHPTRDLVASGQRASRGNRSSAHVRVWSARSLNTLHVLGRKELGAGILAVDFSRRNKGDYLLAVDADREHLLSVWTWDNELIFGRVATHQDHVWGAAFHPLDNNLIVIYGRGLLSLWARRKDGIFTRTDLIEETSGRTIMSLEFTLRGDLITGDHEGMISVWSIDPDGDYYVKREFQAHMSAVNCLQLLSEGTVLSGGDKDRKIIAWDCEEEFEKITETKLPEQAGGVRSLYPQRPGHNDGNIYVGTTRNMILEGSLQRRFNQVIFGHSKQLWGLAMNKSDGTLATAGYDKHIVKWHENQLEWRIQAQSECVSVAVHPMGTRIAAGTIDGHLIVLNGQSGQHVTTVRVCGSPLSCLSYNTAGDTLAVGSQNGSIYLYKSTKDGYLYTRNGKMTGTLPLSGIDWSTSGRYLQTVTSDYDIAYWSLGDLSRVKNDQDVRNETWATQTCPLSYMVHGVWSGGRDAPLQVTLDRSPRGDLVAAGDTDGFIRLYRYPVLSSRAGYHEYKVYTSYVSCVRFSYTDNYLYTIGDTDAALMRWRVT